METLAFEFLFVNTIITDLVCDFGRGCFVIIADFLFHLFILLDHVDESEVIHVF